MKWQNEPPDVSGLWVYQTTYEDGRNLLGSPEVIRVIEADGVKLAGLGAGLWVTTGLGELQRVEDIRQERMWLGPLPIIPGWVDPDSSEGHVIMRGERGRRVAAAPAESGGG